MCLTCLLSSAFVLADKETEQTIAHALITKDEFPSRSLCLLPLSLSVIFLSWLFLAVSWDPLSRREKAQTEHQNARQPSKHLSFVLCTNHDESYWDCSFLFLFCFTFFFFVPGSCFIKFAGETEGKENRQREKKKKKKPTVNYECGGMIKNEPFKNPICHGGVRWEMSEGQSMYCGSLWTLTNFSFFFFFFLREDRWKGWESLLGCLAHSLFINGWRHFIFYFQHVLCSVCNM